MIHCKHFRIILVLLCLGTISYGNVCAEEIPEPSYNLTVSSPIYRSNTENITLDVTIPKHFKPVQTAAQAAALHLLQFIPGNETPENWTEMFVLQIVGNKGIDAAQLTQMIGKKVEDKLGSIQVLTKSTKTEGHYLVSTYGIYYQTGARREISYMNYYSSPGHLSGIQYVRALKADEKPEVVIQDMISTIEKIAKVTTKNPNEKPGLNVWLEPHPFYLIPSGILG